MMSKTLHASFPSVAVFVSCFLLGFAAFNCFGYQQHTSPRNTANPEHPILELTGLCDFTCPDDPNEILMRLYKNGRADFCTYDKKYKQVLRRFALLPEEVQTLIRLARSPRFLESHDKYDKPMIIHDDSSYLWTVRYEHGDYKKAVTILNYYVRSPEAREYYPPGLIALLENILKLRKKYLRHL